MSLLQFDIRNGEDQALRPNNSTFGWTVNIADLRPLVPRRYGTTTRSISGRSGETRIRGLVVEDTFSIPYIELTQLPVARDFVNAMMYGFANPFYLDATDCFGIHRPFYGVVVEDIVPIENFGCTSYSLSVPFTEIPAP